MTEIIKVLGPPGTGKTTTLLNYVEEAMLTTDIKKIGYFSFTRKAAEEARDRAVKKFNLEKKDFRWFSTLHSCGYHCIDLEGRAVMQKEQFKAFGDKIGFNMSSVDSETGISENFYLNEYALARALSLIHI